MEMIGRSDESIVSETTTPSKCVIGWTVDNPARANIARTLRLTASANRRRGRSIRLLRRGGVGNVPAAIAADADIGLLSVSSKTLEHAQPRAIGSDHRRGLVGEHLLISHGLKEFSDPKAAGIAGRLFCRKCMVRAHNLVTVCNVGARPEKQRTITGHAVQEKVGIACHDLYVLGCDPA